LLDPKARKEEPPATDPTRAGKEVVERVAGKIQTKPNSKGRIIYSKLADMPAKTTGPEKM
jgi:hypothetical protein